MRQLIHKRVWYLSCQARATTLENALKDKLAKPVNTFKNHICEWFITSLEMTNTNNVVHTCTEKYKKYHKNKIKKYFW